MKTVTFYSYKGGVGRSLALVNIATRLAEFGKKVCVLDFDLEAPGLHLKFPVQRSGLRNPQLGIVDYVYQFVHKGVVSTSIQPYSIQIQMPRHRVPITLVPAGNTDSADYWKKLSAINWYDLLYENENGLAFFLQLKESIKRDIDADFLLIDSRTGISEMSGITLSLLAEEVVIVAANNRENLGGAKRIINSIVNPKNNLFGQVPKITFVLSRIPFTEKPEDKAKELQLVNRVKREFLLPHVNEVNVIHSDRELEENEKIKIAYERDESTAQSSRDYLALFEKITVNDLSDNEIRLFQNIRNSERYYSYALMSDISTDKKTYISKAIELNDANIDLFIYRANLYLEEFNFDSEESRNLYLLIEDDLNRAISLNELSVGANQLKIRFLYETKQFEQALTEIDRLSANQTFSAQSSFNQFLLIYKGIIYTDLNEYKNAEQAFKEVLKNDPFSADAFNLIGNLERLRGDFPKALDYIYKALEYDSEHAMAFATLAEVSAAKKEHGPFYINLEAALKIDSKAMRKVIREEPIYSEYFSEERFINLLIKYDISIEV